MKKRDVMVPEEDFDAVWERTLKALHCETQKDLGQFLGVTKAAIWNAKEKKRFPAEWLAKLNYWFGINLDWLITGKGSQKAVDSDIGDAIKAGSEYFKKLSHVTGVSKQGKLLLDDSDPIYVSNKLFEDYHKDYVWMYAPDNALAPEIRKDDLMYIYPENKDLDIDGYYVLEIFGKPFVRKVVMDSAELFLATENDPHDISYSSIEEKGIGVLGKIVIIFRKL